MDPPKTAVHESLEMNAASLQRSIAIRHISTHRIVALIEIVSPANNSLGICVFLIEELAHFK